MAQTAQPQKKKSALPLLFLLITLGILGAGAFFVYQFMQGKGASLNPLEKVAQVANIATGGGLGISESDFADIDDPLIRKHLAKQANTLKYKVLSTSDGLGDGSSEITLDFRSETDFRMHMMQNLGAKQKSETITIGDTVYVKDQKDGKWWMQKQKEEEGTDKVTEEFDDYSPEALKEEFLKKTKVSYTSLGEEACGRLTCHKYEEVDGENKRTFWFDTKDLLLRKEVHGFGEFTSTAEYSYDGINVTAPSPTKPVPEGKNIYEMMAESMMGEEASGMMEDAQKMMESDEFKKMQEDAQKFQEEFGNYGQEEAYDEGY